MLETWAAGANKVRWFAALKFVVSGNGAFKTSIDIWLGAGNLSLIQS